MEHDVKIRFNTKCDDGKNFWRIVVDGKEELAEEIRINCPSFTSRDEIKEVGEKFHISCNPTTIRRVNGVVSLHI